MGISLGLDLIFNFYLILESYRIDAVFRTSIVSSEVMLKKEEKQIKITGKKKRSREKENNVDASIAVQVNKGENG